MSKASDAWVLCNGNILTMDAAGTVAQALAIQDDRILAVGSDEAVLQASLPGARVVDLKGRTVIPGMTDGHAHLDREGLRRHLPSLAGAGSIGDIQDVIAEQVRHLPPGAWVVTQPLGDPPEYPEPDQRLAERRYPNRRDLDRVSPQNPVYIRPIWGYWRNRPPLVSIANSAALRLAGIDRHTVSPSPDIRIEQDADGEPNGIFVEQTLVPIVEHTLLRVAPGFTLGQRASGVRHAMREYNRFGTTAIFEGHGVADAVIDAYRQVHAERGSTVRATLTFSPNWQIEGVGEAADLLRDWRGWLGGRGEGDAWLRVQGLYVEQDRDPLNNTLRARSPCTGWAGFQAGAALPEAALDALLLEAARSGIRVAGIWRDLLPRFARAHRKAPIDGLRWVLGHQAVLTPAELAQIRELGVVITTHTNRHIEKDGATWLQRRDAARDERIVPLRDMLELGIPVAFGSDNLPVSLFGPIWHAVARCSRDGTRVMPEQALTRQEALAIATRGGAWLTGDEGERGTLEVGHLADLAVLDRDPLSCPEEELPQIESVMTLTGGRCGHP